MVVGPQRDHEAITLIDAWVHSGLKCGDRAPGIGEPLSKLDFEFVRPSECYRCHPGKYVTWQQAQSELVRVVNNARVLDGQVT